MVSVLGTVAVLLRSEVGWALWTCRFGVLSVLLGSLPLGASSQGLDLLRVIADNALSASQAFVTYIALVLWATSVWYWSRTLLLIHWPSREPGGNGTASPEGQTIAVWLPRALGTATLLLASLAFAQASRGTPEPLHGRLLLHAGYCLLLAGAFLFDLCR